YAIQSWLKHSTEDEQIDAGILKYLSANASQKEAGLVLQSWIKRKVKLAKVYPYVTEHLKNQIGVKASGFLIQAWLDNGLDPEYIKVYVEKWLSIHASTANHYEYVLEKWEKAMGYR
ncbi:MAG TPA: hypothetical protein VJ933_11685, partial [Phaeodactylibacter sp.]|nr:hypothetical protein [Phaeodactylibacter sp.]